MRLLYGHDQAVAAWVGTQNGRHFSAPYTAIGIMGESGDLTGGFVFTGYNVAGIELSCAGRGVASRTAWTAVLQYVFDQVGCVRLQMHTRRKNKRVRKQLPKMGLTFEGVARRFYGDDDGLCFSLVKDELPAFRARLKLG